MVTNHYIGGLIQVWESVYRQRPNGVIEIKRNEKIHFSKQIYFSFDSRMAVHFEGYESENFPKWCGYSRKKCFLRDFALRT